MAPRTPTTHPSRFHRALAVAWIVALWLPLAQMVFRLVPEGQAVTENRRKAAAPRLQGRGLQAFETFRKSFEKYFNDWFGFRDGLIRVHNQLHVRGLRTSPVRTVVIGKEGWLFYNAQDGVNLPDYCGLKPFTEKELDAIERNLTVTRDELRRRGIAFAVLIAPNKHTIYPEYLPDRIRSLAGTTRLDQLAERVSRRPDLPLVDVRQTLQAGKAREPLYFRKDTHWNSYGAHLATRELLASLERAGFRAAPARDGNPGPEYDGTPKSDLSEMLGLSAEAREQDVLPRSRAGARTTVTVLPLRKGKPRGQETITCETGGNSARFLLLRDSFGMAVSPGLCRDFAYGASYYGNRVVETVLDLERPDVVVLEVVERYLRPDTAIFLPREGDRSAEPGGTARR